MVTTMQIRQIFLLICICVLSSYANEEYYRRHKPRHYTANEYVPEYVVQLPVYDHFQQREYPTHKILTNIDHPKEVEISTILSIPNDLKQLDNEVATEAIEQQLQYEQTNKPKQLQYESTNKPEHQVITLSNLHYGTIESDTATKSYNIENKNTDETKLYNKINKTSTFTSHKAIENSENLTKEIVNDEIVPHINDLEDSTKTFSNRIKKRGKQNRHSKDKATNNFVGFGHTMKALNNFLSVDKLFSDIIEPVEENLEKQNKSEPNKVNLYSLIAKATSLNKVNNPPATEAKFKRDLSRNKIKISGLKPLNKLNNIKKINTISKSSTTTNNFPASFAIDEEVVNDQNDHQQELQGVMKNFKLTMKMLANVDMFVSSLLKSYLEKLSNEADNNEY